MQGGNGAYAITLKWLNPAAADSPSSLDERTSALRDLDSTQGRDWSTAETQVIEQLRKVIACVSAGSSVEAAIKQTWADRDVAARSQLR